MKWKNWTRQSHRWISIGFTLIVAAIFMARGIGAKVAGWVFFLPLIPLALLALTGLYMFFEPYVAKWWHRRHASGQAGWPRSGSVK